MPIFRIKCEYEISFLGEVELDGEFEVNDEQIEDIDIIEQILIAEENGLVEWRQNKKFENFSGVEVLS